MHFANLLSCLLFLPAINAAQCSKNPYARFFTIGNTSALVTSDGQFTTILSSFFSAPDIAVESAFKGLFRSVQPLVWSQNNVVIDHPDGRILIDTGSANFPAPSFSKAGLLRENLLAAGIEPSSIKNVLITHGHADHVSGLRTKDGDRAFPNATVYVSRVEHMFWTSEPFVIPNALAPNATLELFKTIYRQSLAPYVETGKVKLVEHGQWVMRGVRYTIVPGHTPGHSTIEVHSAGERLFVVGDSWFSQPDQLRHPDWKGPSFEIYPAQAVKSRYKLLEKLAKEGHLVLAYHEDFPGLGYVVKAKGSHMYDWVPARVEMLGVTQTTC